MAAKQLTPKERLFVAEYLVDKDATNAYRRAGYAAKSAKQSAHIMLKKPHIRDAVQAALQKQEERTLITADQVLLDIKAIGDRALVDEDYAQALRSRELLGKHYKLFAERVEHTGKDGGPIATTTTHDLTDDELAAIAAGRRG
jgi:phage terminase small subunit